MMGTNTSAGGVGELGTPVESTSLDITTDIGAMHYILKRMAYYARNNKLGVILPWQGDRGDKHGNHAKNDALKALCQYYAIPYFDLLSIMINDTPTQDLVRPDGTTPSNNYYSDGGVHFSAYGAARIKRIIHPWIVSGI